VAERIPHEPLLEVEKVLPILDKIPIFAGLTESHLFKVFQRLKLVRYPAGDTIFAVGDSASYIYIIQTGRVHLVFGNEKKIIPKADLEEGACFGETSVIGIQPHSATAIAIEKVELLVLSGDALSELFDADKELFAILILNIARESCRRLYATNHQLIEYLSRNPEAPGADVEGY
jgi:CRP-like cAMP-binding protein